MNTHSKYEFQYIINGKGYRIKDDDINRVMYLVYYIIDLAMFNGGKVIAFNVFSIELEKNDILLSY